MMKKILSFSYVLLVLAFVYVPIFVLIYYSFQSGKVIGEPGSHFTFEWYLKLGKVSDAIVNTVVLALVSSIIATILGTLGAIGMHYHRGKVGRLIKSASQVPVVNSEIVTACALVMTFMLLNLPHRSVFGLYLGHIILTAPFVVLSVIPKLKQMDSSLYEAALDLGATPFQALFKVILPEILPGILSGFMIAITLSLDDYLVTATLAPLGYETISTAVYKSMALANAQSIQIIPIYRALTTIVFFATVLVVIVINVNSARSQKKKSMGGFTK